MVSQLPEVALETSKGGALQSQLPASTGSTPLPLPPLVPEVPKAAKKTAQEELDDLLGLTTTGSGEGSGAGFDPFAPPEQNSTETGVPDPFSTSAFPPASSAEDAFFPAPPPPPAASTNPFDTEQDPFGFNIMAQSASTINLAAATVPASADPFVAILPELPSPLTVDPLSGSTEATFDPFGEATAPFTTDPELAMYTTPKPTPKAGGAQSGVQWATGLGSPLASPRLAALGAVEAVKLLLERDHALTAEMAAQIKGLEA